METQNISPKLRLPTLLFAFFLGMLGVHRFYVGKVGTGIVQLILTITVIGIAVSWTWSIIDCIMVLSGIFTDKNGLKIIKWMNED
jgi:TM2 domain-containing membrane protein YozV